MYKEVTEEEMNQKVIVAFAAGLLIGGLLVWVFGGEPSVRVDDGSDGRTLNERSIDACEEQGGVPILLGSGNTLSDCKGI